MVGSAEEEGEEIAVEASEGAFLEMLEAERVEYKKLTAT
jgi:hypothetical protein